MSKVYVNESGYLNLIRDVLAEGTQTPNRTNEGCISIFDAKVVYEVGKVFPFCTVRPSSLRLGFCEFWFFLRGQTDTKLLEDEGVYFWVGNTKREFLDKRGLSYLKEGDMGKAYGSQLREFGGTTSQKGVAVDQIKQTYEMLKSDKYSRRIYATMWNPNESDLMALTPCHHSHQFVVLPDGRGEDVLHLKVINRSLDALLGMTYAAYNYALYLTATAKLHGFKVGNLSFDLSNVHLYDNQVEYAKEMITRELGKSGVVEITKQLTTLDDLLNLKWEDINVSGLVVNRTPFKTQRPDMVA